jgi:hypothetical protein
MAKPTPSSQPQLDERIAALRTDIDNYIDSLVAAQKKETPGIPAGVLRNLLTARSGDCQCRAYLQIAEAAL